MIAALALLALVHGAPGDARWIGHQVSLGHRELPMMGGVDTRSDTWVVAEITRTATRVEIVERACRVRMTEVAGTQVTIADAAVRRLPPTRVSFRRSGDGTWHAGPWAAGWDASDHDGDGHPGLAIDVHAPLCGGRLHVASAVRSLARAIDRDGALSGELKVQLAQTILEAEGACLAVLARDSDERLRGRFSYRPTGAGATCASLERDGWLDRRWADDRGAP